VGRLLSGDSFSAVGERVTGAPGMVSQLRQEALCVLQNMSIYFAQRAMLRMFKSFPETFVFASRYFSRLKTNLMGSNLDSFSWPKGNGQDAHYKWDLPSYKFEVNHFNAGKYYYRHFFTEDAIYKQDAWSTNLSGANRFDTPT
jgi:hypothetical protein